MAISSVQSQPKTHVELSGYDPDMCLLPVLSSTHQACLAEQGRLGGLTEDTMQIVHNTPYEVIPVLNPNSWARLFFSCPQKPTDEELGVNSLVCFMHIASSMIAHDGGRRKKKEKRKAVKTLVSLFQRKVSSLNR